MVPLAVLIVARKWCPVLIVIGGAALKLFFPAFPAVGARAAPKLSDPQLAALTAVAALGVGVGAVPGVLPTLRPT